MWTPFPFFMVEYGNKWKIITPITTNIMENFPCINTVISYSILQKKEPK